MHTQPQTSALAVLRERFAFPDFRAGQDELIHAVLEGRDALGVMPTGGGKSLVYVLPALLLPAPVLVVSPLIALMKDQVDQLRARRIAADFVNSTVPPDEQRRRIAEFRAGRLRLLYVAPERFRSERFLAALAGFQPGLFAVDEAHCITDWGHDFRPDYLRLKAAAAALGRPPIVALTATATPEVQRQIIETLELRAPRIVVKGFERPNLQFQVRRAGGRDEKLEALRALIREDKTGIVYCATRKSVDELVSALKAPLLRQERIAVDAYHAGLPEPRRREVSERFASRALGVVIATNAFGMGIDRADVRFVAHHDLPGSIEAYTQEAGRAGRDGAPARCVLLYQSNDARIQNFFIDTSYPPRAVIEATLRHLRAFGDGATVDETALPPKVGGDVHPRAVDSALRILAESGVIARDMTRDATTRAARFLEVRPIDFARLERAAERDRLRLRRMIDYAEGLACRRATLVDYFTGENTTPPCGRCEACAAAAARRDLTGGERLIAQTVLELVDDVSERYGRRRLIHVLLGSEAQDVIQAGLHRHRHHGRLKHLSAGFLDALVRELIAHDHLCVVGVEYPLIALTPKGKLALSGREPLELACFDGHVPSAAPRANRPRSERAAAATPDAPRNWDPAVFEALRAWRLQRAREDEVPPFVVFADTALRAIAAATPRTREQLALCKGVGPAKLERYGDELLRVLGEAAG